MAWQYGVPQTVPLVTYSGGVPTAPTNPVATLSRDGGAFAATTNAVVHVADGACYVQLTAAEMEMAAGHLRVTSDNCDPAIVPITTEAEWTGTRAARIDTTISSRSSHSAADVATAVWAAGSRTLTSFGTLVADVATAVWAAAVRTLTSFAFTPDANVISVDGNAVTGPDDFKADVSALALEATLTEMKGAGWTDETLESISAAIAAAAGSGARTLTFTLSDGAGTVAGSLRTHVEDADGNLVAGPRTTSALGVVTYYLDDGTYYLVSADTAAWTGASNAVVVTASAAIAITLGIKALPPPPAPGKYVVIINAADQTDTAVGASGRSYQVTRVLPAADATADLIRSTERDPVVTDANGQASFEIGQTVESLEVLESWTDAAGVARSRTLHLSGFADAADDDGYVQLADVLVRVSGEV